MTLTAAAGSVQGTSGPITVSPAAAASFTVSAPATAGAGDAFLVHAHRRRPVRQRRHRLQRRRDLHQQRRPVGRDQPGHAGVDRRHDDRHRHDHQPEREPDHAHGDRGSASREERQPRRRVRRLSSRSATAWPPW